MVIKAYVRRVRTRTVDDLVRPGHRCGVSKPDVSRVCAELDKQVGTFRDRLLGPCTFPYLFLDATYPKAHEGPDVVSKAVTIATGVRADGAREVPGLAAATPSNGAFWTASLHLPCAPARCRACAVSSPTPTRA